LRAIIAERVRFVGSAESVLREDSAASDGAVALASGIVGIAGEEVLRRVAHFGGDVANGGDVVRRSGDRNLAERDLYPVRPALVLEANRLIGPRKVTVGVHVQVRHQDAAIAKKDALEGVHREVSVARPVAHVIPLCHE